MTYKFKIFVLFISLLGCISGCSDNGTEPITEPVVDTTSDSYVASDFSVAETCQPCHPQHYQEWSGSTHAYAIKDPIFSAFRNIGQGLYIGSLDGACTQCHSPIGKRSGDIVWGPFELAELDPVSQEGIGCDVCHTITSITKLSNGGVDFKPSDTKYGTTQNPVSTPFHNSQYSSLYKESEYCGACHDFLTEEEVPLEAAFREWRELGLGMTGKTCQECHMQEYTGEMFPGGPQRTLHRHNFAGGGLPLIDFPNQTEQRQAVEEMLQLALSMSLTSPAADTAGTDYTLTVEITNDKTGHNVPTGVPFNRQMWLSVLVKDDAQNIIYSSGQLDANDDLMDENSEFPDRDTALFQTKATLFRKNGTHADGTWDAASIVNETIAPYETRVVDYTFTIPDGLSGNLTAEVILRYRSFPPHLIRSISLNELLPLPIIDMNTDTLIILIM